jgi:hypothetical protein
LEDEVISIQGLEGWSWEEEIPQRGRGICPRVITADISPAPQSEQGVEDVCHTLKFPISGCELRE